MAATVANGGNLVEPNLTAAEAKGSRKRALGENTSAALQEWMRQVVQSGPGHRAAAQGWVVGGKTGTAPNDIGDESPHSWFVGFAYPGQTRPEDGIAFAFLIENGGDGGRAAAQAAHDFLAASSPAWRGVDKNR